MSGAEFLLNRYQYHLQRKNAVYEGLFRNKIETYRLKAFGILSMTRLAFFVKLELDLMEKS